MQGRPGQTLAAAPSDPASLDVALRAVRALVARRNLLEDQLVEVAIQLRAAWSLVPHMPVRTSEEIELEMRVNESRDQRMLRAARGNREGAGILKELFYGD